MMVFDLVIKNGKVIDGTGALAYRADVGIVGDRIAAVGDLDAGDSPSIDASGRYISPGFIDTHSHADCSMFLYPDCESYLKQGITTFIGGQCGDSNAPIYSWWMRKYWEYDMWTDIDPFVFSPQTIQPVERVLRVVYEKTGLKVDWRTFSEYAEHVTRQGMGCNMITLAGHSQIRADVMGLSQHRRPDSEEMKRIKAHIDEAFAAGAWGLSTGRDYPPSAYADYDEIIELAEYVKGLGGCYFTHWRRTGPRMGTPERPDRLAGITEPLEVALATGIKTQISHLATGFEIYPEDPRIDVYAARVTLEHIDGYIARGADVAFDVIPGNSGGICTTPYLASLFMPWLKEAGSLGQFVKNIGASDYRKRLLSLLQAGEWYAVNPLACPSWDRKIYITESQRGIAGKNIREIAREAGRPSLETLFDLLSAEPRIRIMKYDKSDEEVRGLLSHPRGFVCTDTYATDLTGMYGNGMEVPEVLPHPHTYCAFPKYILKYGEGTFEESIHKLTGAPASFMGIKERGVLAEGNYADLLVIDRENLRTNESYIEPRVYPEGITHVIVNGKTTVTPAGFCGCRAGRILKK